ncbi:MAG: flagellar basal body P-ring formation chaperone FlgA [Asticcacaulis sp.]
MGLWTVLVLVPSGAAFAQQALTLKAAASDGDGRITVADVFDNAGNMGGVVLGYRTGATAVLDAATVQSIVGANGGYWANPRGQRRIMVTAGPDSSAPGPAAPHDPFPATPIAAAPATQPLAAPAFAPVPVSQPARGAIVVKRSETVSVTWSQGGLSLTMDGIAQKDAAAGDLIPVQNPTSKKMVDAVVTGPGEAIAGQAADRFRATMQLSSR